MFTAARQSLTEHGRVVVVEHLRDVPNALAFGPGALHFTAERTWSATFAAADLVLARHATVTPLVHCYTLARAQ